MTDFEVKYGKEYTVKEKPLPNPLDFLKKHRNFFIAGAVVLFIIIYYFAGWVMGLTVFLVLGLFILFGSNIWDLVNWVRSAKTEDIQRKRVLTLVIIAVGLFGIYAIIKWVVLPTEWGQQLSSFIWKQF